MATISRILATAALALSSSLSWGQDYPTRVITIVAPYAAGGSIDMVARLIGKGLNARLGQPVIVKNIPGAGGTVGTAAVARAEPDGYTLLLASNGPNTVGPSLHANVGFDAANGFAPITMLAVQPMFFCVPPDSPLKSIADVIRLGKQDTGTIGSPGIGSMAHLTGELFKARTGVKLEHVPYKGTAPLTVALMSSEVSVAVTSALDAVPQVKNGKFRALAVSTKERSDSLPDVPTLVESGVTDFHMEVWYGLMAPAKTPRAIVDRLHKEVTAILAEPETLETFRSLSVTAAPTTPEEFDAVVKSDIPKYAAIVKAAGIQAK